MTSSVSFLNVGPVMTRPYNFKATRDSPSSVRGFRRLSFSGTLEIGLADAVEELVVNPSSRLTIGGETGVREYVESESPGLASINGWYLLTSFNSTLSVDPLWPYVDFTLQATYLGDVDTSSGSSGVDGGTPVVIGSSILDGGSP